LTISLADNTGVIFSEKNQWFSEIPKNKYQVLLQQRKNKLVCLRMLIQNILGYKIDPYLNA
jgi:hypothetical protein